MGLAMVSAQRRRPGWLGGVCVCVVLRARADLSHRWAQSLLLVACRSFASQRVCKCGPACAQTCWTAEGGDNNCGEPCLDNSSTKLTFGTGLSGAGIDASEVTVFAHKITPGHSAMYGSFDVILDRLSLGSHVLSSHERRAV